MAPRISWRGEAATKPELDLQEAAEDTEELIYPLITRIGANCLRRNTPMNRKQDGDTMCFSATSAAFCEIWTEASTAYRAKRHRPKHENGTGMGDCPRIARMRANAALGFCNPKLETRKAEPEFFAHETHERHEREVKVNGKVKAKNTSATSAAFCKIWIEVLPPNTANIGLTEISVNQRFS
jgi:hypothetical protein